MKELLKDHELIELARQAREKAYVPYSGFPVGAALVAEDGTVFTGCNIENASYGLALCAERTAIFKMASEGHHAVRAIAVIADTESPVSPCGACRQVLAEFAGNGVRVILSNLSGDVQVTTVGDLLPGAFRPGDLPPTRG